MKYRTMLALALGALWRKKGRNLLTMSGVTIGIFALTMIVSLGEGLSHVITDTVAGEGGDNLRQIGLTGGLGIELSNDPTEIEIKGEMSVVRRKRLRRSAVNRRRVQQVAGRRATTITDAVMVELSKIEHVESVQPIVIERYRVEVGGHETSASLSFGVDVSRDRYRERVMTGGYFTGNDADEVILHEYLLYKWGLVSPEEQQRLIGKTLTLRTIENPDAGAEMLAMSPMFAGFAGELTEEERQALKLLLPKLMERFSAISRARMRASREFKVVGILREFEPGEPFNVVEDANSIQADIYLPHGAAREFFMSSAINTELGYSRALVIVDDPKYAAEVEQTLRDRGYTAFSVASVLQQIDTMLTIVTVIIAFLTGIALLVSTLGIVNTMITSVLERTREIGIYKAVGASDGQVMGMFLTESALIGLAGGLLGLGIAALSTIPGDAVAANLISENAAIPFTGSVFVMPLWLLITGPVLGTLTAVVAAFGPARRAARVDPVTALRHD